jgi:WXXGXW repeat (2 copies)
MKKSMYFFLCLALSLTAVCTEAQVSVGVSIRIGPPTLPVYTQPPCPYDGYLWTPGYWAYGDDGYYWVPGVWIMPPQVGFLWTPGYWGYEGGFYGWHGGYWGSHVGFYGGVNYGYGYGGSGFGGGVWQGGHFRYNTAVVNVNRTVIHNTYIDRTVIRNSTVNRTSFNGPGGITARPNAQEQSVMHENHIQRTTAQATHEQTAGRDRNQFASVNHGRPANPAMNRVNGTSFHPHTSTNANSGSMNHMPAQNHTSPANGSNPGGQSHGQQQQHFQQQQHVQPQHMQQQPQHMQQQPQHVQPQHMQQQPQHMQQQQPQHMQQQPQHIQPQGNPRPEGGGEHHRER